MLPRIVVVASLSAIAIAASGCSGDSDAEAESPPTTTEQVETRPPAEPTVDIAKFRAAFRETFGTPPDERPWYGLIIAMKMAPREIVTATSSYRVLDITTTKLESPSDTVVSKICEAVFALASATRTGIEAVRVIDSDGDEGGGCA